MSLNKKKKRNAIDKGFGCKLSDLIKACDNFNNLHISIYALTKKEFIYANASLESELGVYRDTFLNNDWSNWSKWVVDDEVDQVNNKIQKFFLAPYFHEPFVLKYHILNNRGIKIFIRHEILMHRLEGQTLVLNYFFDHTQKEQIEDYLFLNKNKNTPLYDNGRIPISPREKEVLQLVADGFSSKQIADRLFISNHTAISHRKNLIEKFKVKNTAQLIKRASRSIELW